MTSELYNNGPIKSAATPVFGTAGLLRAASTNKYGATTKPRQNNTPTHREATTKAEDFTSFVMVSPSVNESRAGPPIKLPMKMKLNVESVVRDFATK
jgi:hypothetical protein